MRLAQGIPDERPRFRRWGMRERAQWHRKPLNAGCKMPVTMLASDDGPIFSTVAKLVERSSTSIPEGTQNAERKQEALPLARELLRGTE
jgi:hypothetical protein